MDDNNNEPGLGREGDVLADAVFAGAPAPELDPADYLADMEGFAMTEAQKIELLETLWSIMRSFVEMGVDVGEADPCGQIFGDFVRASTEGVTLHRSEAVTGQNHNKKEDAPA